MNIGGVEFGPVLDASGVRNFFGEGYPFHPYARMVGQTFAGSTFVAKTTTLLPRDGNMPLRKDGVTPREFRPRCIVVKFGKGVALNSVGLSGPGAVQLFEDGRWHRRRESFFISFMSPEKETAARLRETREFARIFGQHLWKFRARVGLQVNLSCPNVGVKRNEKEFLDEARETLAIAGVLGIPLMAKLSVTTSAQTAAKLAESPHCHSLCISNTVPWGALPEWIDWKGLFGTDVSPLAHLGGGGLSGKPLLSIVTDWILKLRRLGVRKPINAGGGILSASDVNELKLAGASSIFIGSVAFLRPWRMRSIIRRAHELF